MRRNVGQRTGYQYLVLMLVLSLALFGLVLIYSASAFILLGKQKTLVVEQTGRMPYLFLFKQTAAFCLGLVGLFVLWKIDYLKLQKYATLGLVAILILLLLVLILPSQHRSNVKRYIKIIPPYVNILPSEFAKLALVIYLASRFAKKQKKMDSFIRGPLPELLVIGVVSGLVFIQPSHTSAIFLGLLGFSIWFFAGANLLHICAPGALFAYLSYMVIKSHQYALNRLDKYVECLLNPLSRVNYHTYQASMSMLNGGTFGVGLGNSKQVLQYLPEPHTDFLWAILAEELGFAYSMILLVIYFLIVFAGFQIAIRSRDQFAKLLAAGVTTCFAMQTIMHLFVVTSLMPTTGVTLPLMSFGGSSLLVTMMSMGILLSVARYAGHFELEGN